MPSVPTPEAPTRSRKLSRVECLMTFIKASCTRRGTKAELARYLGVRPHMISAWLAGAKPNAENALAMVEWIHKQKQKAAEQA